MSRRAILAGLLLAAVALPIATAGAQKRTPTVEKSRHLWATVNVCDPADPRAGIGPDTIGIRASMPGARDGRELMYMRFRVQFLGEADERWHNVKQGGDSGWTKVGRARYKARQSGRNFRLSPPGGKASILLRGKVSFEWRLKGEVVRRATTLTTKGHRSSAGADPAGYSVATCTITR
ncbi:MAG: hypothetical protein WKF42_01930 [Solirubrobacteraceae bacterium]